MHRIIQIKGNHGSGKTTLLNNLIRHRELRKKQIKMGNIDCSVLYDDCTAFVVRQKSKGSKVDGIDAIVRNREDLLRLIKCVINEFCPKDVIYEGAIYGSTFKLAQDINKLATALGYQYINFCLVTGYQHSINRILSRNKGKPINFKTIESKTRSYASVFRKLVEDRQCVHTVVTDELTPQQVLTEFEGVLQQ